MSKERKKYLKKIKQKKLFILLSQLIIFFVFIFTWEILSNKNIINSFIFSSPSRILKEIYNLYINNNLFNNIWVTTKEILISFFISSILSFLLALLFYSYKTIYKILEPFLILFNALPKVALGPLIIIIIGANTNSIIFNGIIISIIVSINTILNGFLNTNKDIIKLFKIYKSSKFKTLKYLIIPSSLNEIKSSLKLNLGLSEIGVIMGEFLSCKEGIGYLILYGSQIFNLSLVGAGIFILLLLSFIFSLFIK